MTADVPAPQRFPGAGGVDLAYRELGEGRPLVLLHGFVSNATVNWFRYGTAAALAARGFRVIAPDLRGHGDSYRPEGSQPPDVLADDGLALLRHLRLTDYDLGGYSLGGRTVARMLVRGATPRRAVIAGMGLDPIVDPAPGTAEFHRVLEAPPGTWQRGTAEWATEAFVRTTKGDPVVLLRVLDTGVPTDPAALAAVAVPTLALVGAEDTGHASARALAALLPRGAYAEIPGTHMGAVTRPELGEAIGDFLTQ